MELRRETTEGVLTVTMDDGNKNALDVDAFEALMGALDDAGDDVEAIVLAGREDIFSAGLDVKFMASASRADMQALLVAFGRCLMRLWTEPRPTVCAATGHAIAAGTMLSMCCDHSVAAAGEHKWGLTETQINFELPRFGIVLARHNMRSDHLEDLLLPGRVVTAEQAVEVGFADELAPADEVLERAAAHAAELTELPARAYTGTKMRLRGDDAEQILAGLEDDIEDLLQDFPG